MNLIQKIEKLYKKSPTSGSIPFYNAYSIGFNAALATIEKELRKINIHEQKDTIITQMLGNGISISSNK